MGGLPCRHKDGNATVTKKYDGRGNEIEEAYFGVDGQPCLVNDGYAKFTRKYDGRDNETEAAFFGVEGRPCLVNDGYAKIARKYDGRGNQIEEVYFGVEGQPIIMGGIGVQLQDSVEGLLISRIVPNGAADRSGQLSTGDRIISVSERDSSARDIRGMEYSDATQLIRGVKGTPVTLVIVRAKPDGSATVTNITVIRDVIPTTPTTSTPVAKP